MEIIPKAHCVLFENFDKVEEYVYKCRPCDRPFRVNIKPGYWISFDIPDEGEPFYFYVYNEYNKVPELFRKITSHSEMLMEIIKFCYKYRFDEYNGRIDMEYGPITIEKE